ncbi:hypothetical protein FRC09_009124, partial [Ceratobasidium sp. 395]
MSTNSVVSYAMSLPLIPLHPPISEPAPVTQRTRECAHNPDAPHRSKQDNPNRPSENANASMNDRGRGSGALTGSVGGAIMVQYRQHPPPMPSLPCGAMAPVRGAPEASLGPGREPSF